jgi:hypothetical protein
MAVALLKQDHRAVHARRGPGRARRRQIAEIDKMRPDEELYDAKVKALGESIKHHVKEEEQPGGIFAQAKKGEQDLAAMGKELKSRKDALMRQLGGDA